MGESDWEKIWREVTVCNFSLECAFGDGFPTCVLAGFGWTPAKLRGFFNQKRYFKASCHIWLCYLWGKFNSYASHSIADGLLSEPATAQSLSSRF